MQRSRARARSSPPSPCPRTPARARSSSTAKWSSCCTSKWRSARSRSRTASRRWRGQCSRALRRSLDDDVQRAADRGESVDERVETRVTPQAEQSVDMRQSNAEAAGKFGLADGIGSHRAIKFDFRGRQGRKSDGIAPSRLRSRNVLTRRDTTKYRRFDRVDRARQRIVPVVAEGHRFGNVRHRHQKRAVVIRGEGDCVAHHRSSIASYFTRESAAWLPLTVTIKWPSLPDANVAALLARNRWACSLFMTHPMYWPTIRRFNLR